LVIFDILTSMIKLKEHYNWFFGSMVSNPFESENSNRTINIEQGVFVPNDPPGVYIVENMAHYNGVLLSVHFHSQTEEWTTVEGSAVMVAPGVAFAAAHVLEPHKRDTVWCTGYTPSGPRYWVVTEVTKLNNSDIVILALKYASAPPTNGRFVQAMIMTRLPGIGEEVMVVDLRASKEHVKADDEMRFPIADGKIRYDADVRIGIGKVAQHHLSGRLPGVGPSPIIEVSCSTAGGLSGGPAFDKFAKVFGILSMSLDHADGRGPSYILMIWPALVSIIRPAFLDHHMPASFSLLDLGNNLCGIDRHAVIRTSPGDEPGQTRIVWDHWT
jgi:hypothetical protein